MFVRTLLCCQPCKYRGITSSAVKYCNTCHEQLCKECVDFHKSFKITQEHLLVNAKGQQSLKLFLDVETLRMCKQHPNKSTEFYCWNHDTLMCSLCLLKCEQHRTCNNKIVEIESVGKLLIDRRFTDTVKEEFQNTISCANHTVREWKEVKEASQTRAKTIRCQIDVLRSKLLETFDRQTQRIAKKAIEINRDINDKYATKIENLEKEIKTAEENEKILETILESGTSGDVFRCLMSILEQIEAFKIEREKHCEDDEKQEIVIVKSDLLKQLETNDEPLVHFYAKETKLKMHVNVQNEQTRDTLKKKNACCLCNRR